MPESPDFDQIARAVVPFCLGIKNADDVVEACGLVAEQLRLMWNARGAADGAALKAELQRAMDLGPQPAASRPTINLEQMIKTLDR